MVITDQLADQQKILKLAILVYNRFFNQPYQKIFKESSLQLWSGGHLMSWLQDVDVNIFAHGDCGSMNAYMDYSMICAGYMAGGKVEIHVHTVQ